MVSESTFHMEDSTIAMMLEAGKSLRVTAKSAPFFNSVVVVVESPQVPEDDSQQR